MSQKKTFVREDWKIKKIVTIYCLFISLLKNIKWSQYIV